MNINYFAQKSMQLHLLDCMFRTKWMYLCKQLLAHGLSMVFPVPFSVLFTRARYTYSQGHQNTATNPKRASERESVLTCCPRSVGRIMKILKSNQAMPAPSSPPTRTSSARLVFNVCVLVYFLRQEANHALSPFVSLAGSSIRPDATVLITRALVPRIYLHLIRHVTEL